MSARQVPNSEHRSSLDYSLNALSPTPSLRDLLRRPSQHRRFHRRCRSQTSDDPDPPPSPPAPLPAQLLRIQRYEESYAPRFSRDVIWIKAAPGAAFPISGIPVGGSLGFTVGKDDGSIMILRNPVERQVSLAQGVIRAYLTQHMPWIMRRFAQPFGLSERDIFLVTTVEYTSDWAYSVHRKSERAVELTCNISGFFDAGFWGHWSGTAGNSKQGPHRTRLRHAPPPARLPRPVPALSQNTANIVGQKRNSSRSPPLSRSHARSHSARARVVFQHNSRNRQGPPPLPPKDWDRQSSASNLHLTAEEPANSSDGGDRISNSSSPVVGGASPEKVEVSTGPVGTEGKSDRGPLRHPMHHWPLHGISYPPTGLSTQSAVMPQTNNLSNSRHPNWPGESTATSGSTRLPENASVTQTAPMANAPYSGSQWGVQAQLGFATPSTQASAANNPDFNMGMSMSYQSSKAGPSPGLAPGPQGPSVPGSSYQLLNSNSQMAPGSWPQAATELSFNGFPPFPASSGIQDDILYQSWQAMNGSDQGVYLPHFQSLLPFDHDIRKDAQN